MPEPTSYRCVSWVAVSSEVQAERESPADQKRKNLELIENLGRYYPNSRGVLVATFEMAASRSITLLTDACALHEQYAELVEMAKARAFDLLVCRSRDRLGHTLPLVTTLEKLCLDHGIVVVPRMSLPPTLSARDLVKAEGAGLMAAIEAQMAEAEVRRMVNRHETGMRGRVLKRKLFANHVPFGYRYEYGKDGSRKIVIDEAAAAVVRLIMLDLYVGRGWGAPRIAKYLNENGIPTPKGSTWSSPGVQQIAARAYRYAGYLELNHMSRTGRDQAMVKGDHPPIISEDELARVLATKKERTLTRTGEADLRLFAGIAYCSICGRRLTGRIATHRNRRTGEIVRTPGMRCCPDSSTVHVAITERKLMAAARAAIAKLEELSDLSDYVDEDLENRLEILQKKIESLQRQREASQEQRKRLVDLYIEKGKLSQEEFGERIDAIEKRLAYLDDEEARFMQAVATEENAKGRTERLEGLRHAGTRLLDLAEENPLVVRNWLRSVMRIYVGKRGTIERIEFI